MSAGIIAYWSAGSLSSTAFALYYYRDLAATIGNLVPLAVNLYLLYLIRKPTVRNLYGVNNTQTWTAILTGAAFSAVSWAISWMEPYLRL